MLPFQLKGQKLTAADSILHCAMRAPWGVVYAGGQVGGADEDLRSWNENNAYSPFRGAPTWGVWGGQSLYPNISSATNLSVVEVIAHEGRDEIARVPDNSNLTMTHGLLRDPRTADEGAPSVLRKIVRWRWELVNCATGATTSGDYDFVSSSSSFTGRIAQNVAAGSYLLRTRFLGEENAFHGQWSTLKVIVGNGQWIGDRNCHLNATFSCLWRVDGTTLVPVVLNPCAVKVGALTNYDGRLWIGGELAGRSGSQPFIARLDNPTLNTSRTTTTPAPFWSFYCECILATSKMVNSIAFPNGVLHATTPCDSIIYDEPRDILIDAHPGGRCGGALHVGKNKDVWVKACEQGDFATNTHYNNDGWARLAVGEPGAEKSFSVALHHVLACLATKNQFSYYVEDEGLKPTGLGASSTSDSSPRETPTLPPTRFQALARFNGQSREIVARWDTSRHDLAHIGIAGQYVWAFGHTLDLKPSCARFDSSGVDKIARTFETNLHLRNISMALSEDGKRETLLVIGKETDTNGLPLASWGVYELDVQKFCFSWNSGARKFSISRTSAAQAGADETKLPPFLFWMSESGSGLSGGGQWMAKSSQPATGVWLQLLPITGNVISYQLPVGQTLPYSSTQWDCLCFDGLSWQANACATNAATAMANMPAGTVVSIVEWPELGEALSYPVSMADIGGEITNDISPEIITSTVSVFALSEAWTNSGVDLQNGLSWQVTTTGTVRLTSNGSVLDSDGDVNNGNGFPYGSLVGIIKPSGVTPNGFAAGQFFVGKNYSSMANQSGRLWLRVNDNGGTYGDNLGSFAVAIQKSVPMPETTISGRVLDELYPWLWLSSDGVFDLPREPGATLSANDLLALQEFDVRARGWQRHTPLPLSARRRVRACYLVPPGYHVRKKALLQVG